MTGRTTRLVNNVIQKTLVPTNFHVDSGFFTTEDVDRINNYFSTITLREGEVFEGNDYSQRKAKLHFVERPDLNTQWIYDKLNVLIGYYNDTLFDYDLEGYDYMQYAEYHTGGHQRFHTDIRYDWDPNYITEGMRKLTVVLMLSDPSEYEGGDFLLNLSNEAGAYRFKLKKGDVIIFPSYIPHQVDPVISGVRKTLVVWPLGPKFR